MDKNIFQKIRVCFLTCFLLLALSSCTGKQIILTSVDEKEANQIIVLLKAQGIHAEKIAAKVSSTAAAAGSSSASMWDISVNSSQATAALAILNRKGLPRKPGVTLLDIFPGGGLMQTEKEQDVRYQEGLNEQLASTIRKFDGVLDAEVQISKPKVNLFATETSKETPTAAVYVKHNGIADDPNSLLSQKIKLLVSGSIVDLSYDDVTVVLDRARYTDVSLNAISGVGSDEYVKVWSMMVSKSSAGRIRGILIFFCIILLVLLIALVWLVWKCQKTLRRVKNIKDFFVPQPFESQEEKKAAQAPPEEAPPEEEESEEEE